MKQISEILKDVVTIGMTIFLVEQNAIYALKLGNYVYVVVHGEIRVTGTGAALSSEPGSTKSVPRWLLI